MKRSVFLSSVAAVMAFAAMAQETSPVELTVHGSYSFGYVDGFMQTPLGGVAGSSSKRRPDLSELGIHDGGFYDAGLDVRWGRLGLTGGYQDIGLDGSGRLSSPLVSHGVSFAAGDAFRMTTRFDWFHLGGGWRFELAGRRLEIMPKADLAVLDFSYRLKGPTETASRSYAKGSFRLGLEGSWEFNEALSLKLDGAASVPISNTPQIATCNATLNWRVWRRARWFHPALFFGGGAEWIDYEDNQRLPNHLRLNLGPFVTGGLAISF